MVRFFTRINIFMCPGVLFVLFWKTDWPKYAQLVTKSTVGNQFFCTDEMTLWKLCNYMATEVKPVHIEYVSSTQCHSITSIPVIMPLPLSLNPHKSIPY